MGRTRRPTAAVAAILSALALGLLASPAPAQDGPSPAARSGGPLAPGADVDGLTSEQRYEVRIAARNGLRWLADKQPASGRIGDRFPVATTALSGLAFMANGSTYNRGPHAENIRRTVDYLTSARGCQEKNQIKISLEGGRELRGKAYFFNDGTVDGRMHGHGFATLFLAQVYGTMPRDLAKTAEVREKLRGGLLLSLASQTGKGGWGYKHPFDMAGQQPNVDEASVTVTQIQALRAARNAGFQIPSSAIKNAVGYVKECMKKDGSCQYSLTMRNRNTTYELTAAAVSTLNASGQYDSVELGLGLDYLAQSQAKAKNPARAADQYYYYGNFYAAQAMFQAGPTEFGEWFGPVHRDILDKARPRYTTDSGCWWEDERKQFGREYATAVAVLILEIPQRLLPIFQR